MDGRDITLILGTILIGKMRKKKIYPCDISCTITPTYIHEETSNFHGASRFQYPGGRLIPKLTAMYTGVSTPEWTGG